MWCVDGIDLRTLEFAAVAMGSIRALTLEHGNVTVPEFGDASRVDVHGVSHACSYSGAFQRLVEITC